MFLIEKTEALRFGSESHLQKHTVLFQLVLIRNKNLPAASVSELYVSRKFSFVLIEFFLHAIMGNLFS